MALTRAFLNGMGLTADQVSAIIEAHVETVDGLKEERDGYKTDAEKLGKVQKELEALKASQSDDASEEWKAKYEAEKTAFESFKSEQITKAETEKKAKAYTELLMKSGVAEKVIPLLADKVDLGTLEFEEDGTLKGSEELTKGIQEKWSDFIVSNGTQGVDTTTPPAVDQIGGEKKTIPLIF